MGRGVDLAWSRLPDYVTTADDGTLQAWLAGIAGQLDPALAILDMADPATSVSASCEIASATHAPRSADPSANWLGWLGWLVGIDTSALPEGDVRDAIANAITTQRRGSAGAIRQAVQRSLTGGRSCRVYHNVSGTDPYLISVVTVYAETPDEADTLAAAWSEKPAGCDLELIVISGSIYAELTAGYATYADTAAAFDTYADMNTWTP